MKTCSVENCKRPYYARGLCEPHYRRQQRTGRLRAETAIGELSSAAPCAVAACAREATERGLCHSHYLRLSRTGRIRSDEALRPYGRRECSIADCGRSHYARGLCRTHYRRLLRTGDVQAERPVRDAPASAWVNNGYRLVTVKEEERWLVDGKTHDVEHRLVMARMLGRPLTADESVHHRNGDRLDNRAGNLELWSRWQPSGQRVADKIEFALEILGRYLPDALVGQLPLDAAAVVPPSGFEPPLPP